MASPQIKTPAEIIFDNTPSASAVTPASGQTLLGVDDATKKLYSVNDAGVKTDYDAGGGGGGGGSGIMGQDEGAPIGTGTVLNVTGNLLQLSISGSVLRLNQTDPTFLQEVIGIYGQNQGVPLGTGTILNVDGTRLSMSISGSVLRLTNSTDLQELIGVLGRNQGTILGTGTTIDWGLGMNAAITGSVLFVHPFAGGVNSQVWTRNTGTVQGASWSTAAGTQKGTLELTVATVPLPSGTTNSGAPIAGLDGLSSPFEGIPYYEFISTPVTYREFYGRLKNYGGGGLTIKFEVLRTSAGAAATYIFEAAIRRINTGTEDLGASHTYDYNAVTVTIPAGPPNAGIPMAGTITFTDGADMDSLASGEACVLRFRRNGGTATDTARVLVTITVEET